MRRTRRMLTVLIAALGVSACASTSTQHPAALPNGASVVQPGSRRMETSSPTIIYVGAFHDSVYMLDYSTGELLGKFNPPSTYVAGMCTDASGDVFVVGLNGNPVVIRYLHGASIPSESLEVPGQRAFACSVDPTTGNLAVLFSNSDAKVLVAIYQGGSGTPTSYMVSDEYAVALSCAYDSSGDLLVDFDADSGVRKLAELIACAHSFTPINLRRKSVKMSQLLWVTSYFAVGYPNGIYHIHVSRSDASITGRTSVLDGKPRFWIQDGATLLEPFGSDAKRLGFWPYPQGGKATKRYGQFSRINAIVVSSVPTVRATRLAPHLARAASNAAPNRN
jgi:hypothetical protein